MVMINPSVEYLAVVASTLWHGDPQPVSEGGRARIPSGAGAGQETMIQVVLQGSLTEGNRLL